MKNDLKKQFYLACDTAQLDMVKTLLVSKKLDFNMLVPIKKYATENNIRIVNCLLENSLSKQKISINHNNRLFAAAALGFIQGKGEKNFLDIYHNPDYAQFFQDTTVYEVLKTLIENKHFNFAQELLNVMQLKAKKLSLYTTFHLNHIIECASVVSKIIESLSHPEDKSFEFNCWENYLKNSPKAIEQLEKRIVTLARDNTQRIIDLNEHFELSKNYPQIWINALFTILSESIFSIAQIVTNTVPSRPSIEYMLAQIGNQIDPQYYSEKKVMENLEKQENIIFDDFLMVVATRSDILEKYPEFAQKMLEKCINKKLLKSFNLLVIEKNLTPNEKCLEIVNKDNDYKDFQNVLNYHKINQALEQKSKKMLRKI